METATITSCELCESPIFPKNEDSTKRFPVKYMRYDILCQTCYSSEKRKIEENKEKEKPIIQQSLENIVSKRDEFFNAERTDIALLAPNGTHFEKILAIKERIDKWKNLLFEIRTREESAHSLLQELAQKISSEERAKLKLSDISYVPTSTTPKAKAIRISKEDKALLSIAKTLFSKDIAQGLITEEQAIQKAKDITRASKNIMIGKMASGELKCSCSETPGICRVHEKV